MEAEKKTVRVLLKSVMNEGCNTGWGLFHLSMR